MQYFVNYQYYPKFTFWIGTDKVKMAALRALQTLMFISRAIWRIFIEKKYDITHCV